MDFFLKNSFVNRFSYIVWVSVSLIIAVSLVIPDGYSIGALLVIFLSVFIPLIKKIHAIDKFDMFLIFSFMIYFLGMFFLVYIDGFHVRELDKPVRFLLVVPPLLLLLRVPLFKNAIFLSCVFGAFGAFTIAIIDRVYFGVPRAGGDENPIMFGGISILTSVICLNYALYFYKEHKNKPFLISICAFYAGLFASILSVSKGGWLILPIAVAFLFWNYRSCLNKKFYLNSIVITLLIISFIFFIPSLGVSTRLSETVNDVNSVVEGSQRESSISHRTELWKASIYMFVESPIVGIGKSEQHLFKENLVAQEKSNKSILRFNHAHNEYFNELGLRGLFGLLLLLIVYLVPLALFLLKIKRYSGSKNIKVFAISGALVSISYMVFALTQSMFAHNSGVMMYAFSIVIFWAATRWAEREERELGNIA